MRLSNKAGICFSVIILLLFTPINAFAMDTAFVSNPEIWYEKSGVCSAIIRILKTIAFIFT